MFRIVIISNKEGAKKEIQEMIKKGRKKRRAIIKEGEKRANAQAEKVKNLKKEIGAEQKRIRELEEKNEELTSRLRDVREKIVQVEKLESDKSNLESQLKKKEEEFVSLRKEYDKKIKDFQEIIIQERKLLAQLSKENSSLKKELQKKEIKLNEQLSRNREAERALKKKLAIRNSLKEILEYTKKEEELLIGISNEFRNTHWPNKLYEPIFELTEKIEKQIDETKKMRGKLHRWLNFLTSVR